MIISAGRRYIFVHIPKTGGTSLAMALEARAMADDILIGDTPKAKRRKNRLKGAQTAGRLWKHSTLADIEGLVSRDALPEFQLFTLVRNPWDRAVSYYHWLRDQDFDHPAVPLAKSTDFAGFLQSPMTQVALSVPARHYMTDAAGQVHPATYLRLEDLPQGLAPLEAHLGFSLAGAIGRENRSDRAADYRQYYSDENAALIQRLAAEDIARFGYRFLP